MPYNKISLVTFAIFISILCSSYAYPVELESEYFSTAVHDDIDLYEFVRKIDLGYLSQLDIGKAGDLLDMETLLKSTLDKLYLMVSDTLGIRMYSFKMNLKVLPDRYDLKETIKDYVDGETDVPSYYYKQKNTIYISFNDMTIGMLAHEIAHAVIAHYFVVAPPPNTQEILSGYVEYTINKAINSRE
jgi:hypothetical protein